MRFVDDEPVRPALVKRFLLQLRQQRCEECGSVMHFHTEKVDDDIRAGTIEQLKDLLERWRMALVADGQETFEGLIVAFRIYDARLIVARQEALDEAGNKGRFAAAGLATEKQAFAGCGKVDIFLLGVAKRDLTGTELGRKRGKIVGNEFFDKFGDSGSTRLAGHPIGFGLYGR